MELGNRNDMKAGAAVTSLANGIASFGGILEGPVVAVVFAWAGWNGVLYASILSPSWELPSSTGPTLCYRVWTEVRSNPAAQAKFEPWRS